MESLVRRKCYLSILSFYNLFKIYSHVLVSVCIQMGYGSQGSVVCMCMMGYELLIREWRKMSELDCWIIGQASDGRLVLKFSQFLPLFWLRIWVFKNTEVCKLFLGYK